MWLLHINKEISPFPYGIQVATTYYGPLLGSCSSALRYYQKREEDPYPLPRPLLPPDPFGSGPFFCSIALSSFHLHPFPRAGAQGQSHIHECGQYLTRAFELDTVVAASFFRWCPHIPRNSVLCPPKYWRPHRDQPLGL